MLFESGGLPGPVAFLCAATGMTALSGVPGLFLGRRPGWGQKAAAALSVLAALLAIPAATALLLDPRPSALLVAWNLPFGPCELDVDPLSALFLLPVFLASACCAVYAVGYRPEADHPRSGPALTFFSGTLAASMALLAMARNGVLFLMAWEVMALSAYFALVTEHRDPEVREAGTVYLIATHAGTAMLFVLFALLRAQTGSFLFPAMRSLDAGALSSAVFLVALAGFGAKAGLMPFHIWLPSAHANAPSHVSALLSGVMLKMGVYGILRTVLLFRSPPMWWGVLLVLQGSASAVLGIVFAAAQRDLKRLLACSSIENIGIVALGAGAGLAGVASGNATLAVLGMAGALLHVLHHALFKPLLFLGSGALIHAAGTREIDRMGGMAKRMPRTALLFLVGAAAICGLPPLNGFASEFLLYFGFLSEARSAAVPWLAAGAPVLAFVGGVAAVAFVKLYGVVFLGAPRTEQAAHGHEPGPSMLVPMGVLASSCVLAGALPLLTVRLVEPAVAAFLPPGAPVSVASVAPLEWLTAAAGILLAVAALAALLLARRLRTSPVARTATWGCGYLAPSARMQYTGASFAGALADLFGGAVRPRRAMPAVEGVAPRPSAFRFDPTETILARIAVPLFSLAGLSFAFIHRLQHGRMHIYMLYIFVTLFLLMIWAH